MGERVCNGLGNPRAWLVALVALACGLAALGGPGSRASAAGEGSFQFSSATYSAPEGTFAHVTVNRIGGTTLTAPVVVTLELSGHTTNEDVPAAAVTQLLTFPANSNLASLTADIQTLNINRFVDKPIQITIRSVSCACAIGFPGTATITILGTGTPRVTDVFPKAGGFGYPGVDTIIHVTGQNFTTAGSGVSFVHFNPTTGGVGPSVPPSDFVLLTPTSLNVKLPAGLSLGASYHIQVEVTVTATSDLSLSKQVFEDQFVRTTNTGPAITSLSTHSGTTVGGTVVQVSGVGFDGVPGNPCGPTVAAVTFGGVPATGPCFYAAPGTIQVVSPPHPIGIVDVVVQTLEFSPATADTKFTFTGGPIITSINPAAGPPSGGNTVVITGSGFLTNLLAPSSVLFGGNAAAFITDGDTQIRAVAPPGTGLQQITVVHPIGGTSPFTTAANYSYNAGPLIASISPPAGPVVGGTVVTITGSGFLPGAQVFFGLTQATFVLVDSATQIRATSPAGIGVVFLTVVVNGATSPTTPLAQFSYAGPTVTSILPIAGPIAGGTVVTVTGTNFTNLSSVQLGPDTLPGTAVVFVSPTILTVTMPAVAAPKAVDIRVTSISGQSPATPADVFTYTSGPIIDSLNPNTGSTNGGTIVVITGKNFSAGVVVTIAGANVDTFNVNSATQITILTPPAAAAGAVDVRVRKGSDISPVGAMTKYTYASSSPKITALTPNSGSTFGGVQVSITGIGLSGAVCPGAVKFGTIAAPTCTVINDTAMTAESPPNVAGPTVVTVVTPNGTTDIVPNYTYVTPANGGGGSAPPAPDTAGLATYSLSYRWSLLTWTGKDTVPVLQALRGTGVPGATDISSRVGAVYQWDGATVTWKAYFTGADGIPGAVDFNVLVKGAVYWIALVSPGGASWTFQTD